MRLLALMLLTAAAACGRGPQAETDAQAQRYEDGAGGAFAPSGSRAASGRPFDPSSLPAGAVALERVAIEDPGVIAKGPALFALVPAGWRASGGVSGPTSLCSEPFVVDWVATSPDGASSLGLFPTEIWQWSTFQMQSNCQRADFRDVRSYLAAKVAALFPGARVIDYRDRPDFARSSQDNAQRINAAFAAVGLQGMNARAGGGEVLFAFERGGVEMRGVAGASAVFYESRTQNPLDGSEIISVTGQTNGTFLATATNGKLDFTLIEASRRSIAPDPRWLDRLFALKTAIGEIETQGTRERAALIVAGGAEATRSNIEAFRSMTNASIADSEASVARQTGGGARELFPGDAAGDRMQRETIESIRGVETWTDPVAGANVQLDANYDHAWRVNGRDAYILTKDPNFNPGQYGIEATQMGVAR
jgi:hypothetical protein